MHKSTLFQELIRMCIRAICRLSLKHVLLIQKKKYEKKKETNDMTTSPLSLSPIVSSLSSSSTSSHHPASDTKDDDKNIKVKASIWLKRIYMLFVASCNKDEYYSQPDCELYLMKIFCIVKNIQTTTLQSMVTRLNRNFSDVQGIAIIKRSRHTLRRNYSRKSRKVKVG